MKKLFVADAGKAEIHDFADTAEGGVCGFLIIRAKFLFAMTASEISEPKIKSIVTRTAFF